VTEPKRRIGTDAVILRMQSSPSSAKPSVAMLPGNIALPVMPYGASSMAAVRMKPSCPALLAP
jgi:hypothetical protein